MERPITIQEFEDLPLLRSTFFHFGLGLEGNNAASIIDTNEAGEVHKGLSFFVRFLEGFHISFPNYLFITIITKSGIL